MDRRQVYIISVKLLALLGVVIIMAVMINSLFPAKESNNQTEKKDIASKPESIEVFLEMLVAGKMTYTHWAGRPVGIIKRLSPPAAFEAGEPLNANWRSIRPDYFVFFNEVGIAKCPLYLFPDGKKLKDTCTGVQYDLTGRRIERSGEPLQIPPHYFIGDKKVIIGQWDSGK